MTTHTRRGLAATAVASAVLTALLPTTAQASPSDRDGDGLPNRWERAHGLDPQRAADARGDVDRDGLTNLAEYRQGTRLRDEDTDDDGVDDGDEVRDGLRGTAVRRADTDRDGLVDGEEDLDGDGVSQEDEDDALEPCRADDDDRDRDDVADEDEDDHGHSARDADSDDDGVLDGDEDSDDDGEADEDGDDSDSDRCDGDLDGDGRDDEDEGDRLGVVESFDEATGALRLTLDQGGTLEVVVTQETEIELEEADEAEGAEDTGDGTGDEPELDDEGTTADLQPGTVVAEVELDDDGTLEEIAVYRTV